MAKVKLMSVGSGYAAESALNANSGILIEAFENTLSRNGSPPNEMQAEIDMNDYRIINMGWATNPRDAVSLEQAISLVGEGSSGGGGIVAVGQGQGIDVDVTNPQFPIVSLDDDALEAMAQALESAENKEPFVIWEPTPDLPRGRVLTAGAGIHLDVTNPGEVMISHPPSAIDHGALTGLTDDDHPQYTQAAALETITGAWTYAADVKVSSGHRVTVGSVNTVTGRPIEVVGNGTTASSLALANFAYDGTGSELVLSKSKTDTVGNNLLVNNNDVLGQITARGANGTNYTTAAQIRFEVDGTPGPLNDMPGRVVIATTPDGSDGPVDRARWEANGNTIFNTKAAGHKVSVGYSDALSFGGISVELMANGVNLQVSNPNGSVLTLGNSTFNTTGTLNNMSPVYAPILTWTGASPLTITGITPAAPGQVLVISNTNTTVNNIVINHEDLNSTATNRFQMPNNGNITVQRGSAIRLWYNPSVQRWMALGAA